MSSLLPKLSAEDFEVTYSRKRKISCSSTGSSSPNSSCSSSTSSAHPKNLHSAATPALKDDFLQRKRTIPTKFCPKQGKATSRFHPINVKENTIPKVSSVPRPLCHMPQRPLVDSNKNMMAYREFRELEKQKAQAAKLNGAPEEPPKKKRAQRRKFNN